MKLPMGIQEFEGKIILRYCMEYAGLPYIEISHGEKVGLISYEQFLPFLKADWNPLFVDAMAGTIEERPLDD